MAKRIATSLAVALLTMAAAAAQADVLLLDGIEIDKSSQAERPMAGMSMDRVESTYGAPAQKHATVGNPPITRWDYPGFSVYFENDKVIHAVARHAS